MPEENVYRKAVEFLLDLVQRTGHNPEYHQAQGLLVRIEEFKRAEDDDRGIPAPVIHAMDSESFLDFVRKNPGAIQRALDAAAEE